MVYGVKCFFEINEYHCCILTFIDVKIQIITFTFKQASSYRVQAPKPRLLGKKFISVKVVIKLIVNEFSKTLEKKGSTRIRINFT